MIKLPVTFRAYMAPPEYGRIKDVNGDIVLHNVSIEIGPEIVSALNAQKPKCETCGGSKRVPTEQSKGFGKENQIMDVCPDCQPATQAGELVGRLRNSAGVLEDGKYRITAVVKQNIIENCYQAAARIEELGVARTKLVQLGRRQMDAKQKALARIKELEKGIREIEQYAYKNHCDPLVNEHGCLYKIVNMVKAILGEETKNGQK